VCVLSHVCISSVFSVEFQLSIPSPVGTEVGVVSSCIAFTFAKSPLSLSVITQFCMSLPVVESNRAIALSVDDAGHTTSPLLHPPPHALDIVS